MHRRRIATYDDWRAQRFFPGLEGIRAVAALLVVFHHARAHWLWGGVQGWNGVTLFFVLSGFLITTLGLREEERLGALRWGAFFVRRAFRILPLYLVSFALYAALVLGVGFGASHRAAFAHAVPWYLSPFPEHVFFSHAHAAFALSWSLGIEEKFYVVWPLVAFVVLRRRFRARLAVAIAAAVGFQIPVAVWGGGRVVLPYTAILVGCALALLMHRRETFARVARLGSGRGLALTFAALVAVHVATSTLLPVSAYAQVATPFYYLPYSLAAAAFVASVALRARGSRVLESPPLRLGGRVSYGLYLIHPIGLAVAETVVPAGGVARETAALALGLALSVAAAYALHRIVERPLIAVGRRLAAAPRPLPAAAGARVPRVGAPRIAVVIPCYNDGRLVVSAVDSVREEEPVELVVVSDGTTDADTLAALAELESRGVRVLRRENAGLGAARMAGVDETTADFVFPLDADDMLLPGALAQLADLLEVSPHAGFAWGDFTVVDDRDEPVQHVTTARTFDRWVITFKDPIPASILFRREALLEVGGWDLRHHEEWDLMLKFAASRWDGVKLARPVYLKRVQYRRLSTAANDVRPEVYRLLRDRHADLFARRRELARASHATLAQRLTLPLVERLYSRKPTLAERLLREFRWYRRSYRGSSAAALVGFVRERAVGS